MTDPSGIVEIARAIRPPADFAIWIMALAFVGGVITAAVKISPAWVERMNERARDKAAERSEDWKRLREEIGRLADRVKTLEDTCDVLARKVRDCEDREANWMRRAIQAEAALQGQGEVRQAAAAAQAEIRLDASDKAKKAAGR